MKNGLQAFDLLHGWSETITDCTETVDLLQISHFGAEQSSDLSAGACVHRDYQSKVWTYYYYFFFIIYNFLVTDGNVSCISDDFCNVSLAS